MAKKLPKWRYPNSIEKDYRKDLNRMIDQWFFEVENIIIPQYDSWLLEYNGSINRDDWSDDIDSSIIELEERFDTHTKKIIDKLPEIALGISLFNKKQWDKIMKSGLGMIISKPEPWIISVEKNFTSTNISLIKKMQSDTLDGTRKIINDGIKNNRDSSFVKRQLMSTSKLDSLDTKSGESNVSLKRSMKNTRARVIARDQTGKLNGTLTENRQKSIGVSGYTWRNSQDERVRGNPSGKYPDAPNDHWSREGKKFLWDYSTGDIPEGYEESPPPDGNPGEAINCRCFAEPDFSTIELPLVA